jgi:Glycosyl transferases group 1
MTRSPRALVFSKRNTESRKWQALQYEFEDVVALVDDVNLLAPSARPLTPVIRLSNRVLRAAGHPERSSEPASEAVTVEGEHSLFFAVFSLVEDIPNLLRLGRWRDRCDKAVCVINELLTHQIAQATPYLELLRHFEFDRVFLLNPRPKDAVARIVGCETQFLPLGVDALRFSPYPDPPARVVYFYQFGRRSPVTHTAALEMAQSEGVFYLYDTVFNVPLPNFRAHRQMIAEIMKRSRYFFAYRPGEDLERSQVDDDLAARYFEGVGGGAILLGSAPATPEYEECFGWPDSTIEIPYEAHNLREIVADLEADPERLARARTNNIVEALRRHDWVYRWAEVLQAVGLPPTARMAERMERLDELATMAERRSPA